MTVGALGWRGTLGADIHAIAPMPTRTLHDALNCHVLKPGTDVFEWRSLAGLQTTNPTAAATFTPRLAGTSIVAGATVAHDIVVNRGTGTVFFGAGWPTRPSLSTFLIEVDIVGIPKTPDFQPITIRVHLHEAMDVLWLTPAELVIRPGKGVREATQQLTALARFDDGVIGDVTEDVPTWTPNGWTVHGTGGVLSVDARTGTLWTAQESGTWTVELDIPAIGIGRSHLASADVQAAPGWSAERSLTWLGGPGPDMFDDVPNVLFVAEGFTKAPDEEPNFSGYIQEVRERLFRSVFRPYNHARTSVNFWSVFVESSEPGPSVLTEHSLSASVAAQADATAIPPAAPLGGAGPWTLEQLIGVVGLPVPVYESTNPTDLDREAHWQALYGVGVTHANYGDVAVPPATLPALELWKSLTERTFLEQASTAFGLCHGSFPRAQSPGHVRAVSTNSRRAGQSDLDDFFSGLAYPPGQPIGHLLWGRVDSTAVGKDRGLVCFVYRSPRYGGARSTVFFTSTTGPGDSSGNVMGCSQTGPRWSIDFSPPPQGPFPLAVSSSAVVAHELGHALGLGDEYGGSGTTPSPANMAATVNANGNLRHAGTVGEAGSIDMSTTPWHAWPRVTKAGLTAFEPSAADATTLTVLMAAGHAALFEGGDVVQLRSRALEFDVGAYPLSASDTFTVERVDDDEITMKALPGSALPSVTEFPMGSVVIGVLLDAQGAPLPLLSKLVKDHIETSQVPVNRVAGAACEAPLFNGIPTENSIAYARSLPADLLSPSPPPEHIVGLYDGGSQYNCGVYHPTGICLMRGLVVREEADPHGGVYVPGLYSFCHVCRYVLADRLLPVAHADIDRRYGANYPT